MLAVLQETLWTLVFEVILYELNDDLGIDGFVEDAQGPRCGGLTRYALVEAPTQKDGWNLMQNP